MVKYALPVGVTSEVAAGVSNDPQIPGEAPPSVGGAVRGTAGADQARWFQLDEVFLALAGNDAVWAGQVLDQVCGQGGNDLHVGEAGTDILVRGASKDRQYG